MKDQEKAEFEKGYNLGLNFGKHIPGLDEAQSKFIDDTNMENAKIHSRSSMPTVSAYWRGYLAGQKVTQIQTKKMCGCGKRQVRFGNYCDPCLDNEMSHETEEDIEASLELHDRIASAYSFL